ncbi:YegS/Rv2252/BmrU family lipid kinase [Panacibacter ginsenosidivorans]|uniref:YegS/Rv2252/BmrU family lipid kinase n=1 Tax=Panacibacter ginsenosidivorans TaxID=1813871 RepID=A0A5B8V8H5_9BACT|nr:YegS/Rv2252/BmrU family lipid kinase [Panacibacter ginsenosidivorans]QEC67642.1 YegS/Rv2252/BmrU family lipid kinase [Panacibacter ginsenosidivorans]
MKRKIIFLANPISGGTKKDSAFKHIDATFKKQQIPFEILPTVASGDYDFLKAKIREENITDIVIIGGDASVNQVVQSLRTEKVRFGIIPFGSGNGFAFAAGIPKNVSKATKIILEGKSSVVDAFKVNEEFSCMLSGIGFDAKVAHDFAAKSSRGLITYTQQSIINFFKAHPYQFEVSVDGFSLFTEAFFISVANANQFGNNFTIAPKASLNDGMLDVVIVQKMNKAKLPFAILKQLRGNNKMQQLVEAMSKKNVLYFQTDTITINNIKQAPLHIDGEPKETAAQIKFEIIKDCFDLLQPSKN